MRKILFGFALAAAGLLMASCGGKETSKTVDSDSAATDSAAVEQAPEERGDSTAGEPGKLDVELFSLDVPRGWRVERSSSFGCKLEPVKEPASEKKNFCGWSVIITVWEGNDFSLKATVDNFLNVTEGAKKMDPLTFGDVTYDYYFDDYEYGKSSLLAASIPGNKGVIEIQVCGYGVEDSAVQEILKSFKLKTREV